MLARWYYHCISLLSCKWQFNTWEILFLHSVYICILFYIKYSLVGLITFSSTSFAIFKLYIQGVMGKWLSKLCRNENNTDISLYQIYENILKYYKSNSFKEISISFNHYSQMILESPINPFQRSPCLNC